MQGGASVPGKASPFPAHLQMESVRLRTSGQGSPTAARGAAAGAGSEPAGEMALAPPPSLNPTLLLAVAVAAMGGVCFGYHLGVVNGPLEAIAADLGFGGNAGLQGAVGGLRCTERGARPIVCQASTTRVKRAAQRSATKEQLG